MDKHLRILLVEDNPGDIMLINEALENDQEAKICDIMTDGEKAIQYFKEGRFLETNEQPNLVLLDINLPRINGLDVLKFIKSNEKTKEMPVVMLSSSSSDDDITKSYREYANCYIIKPCGVNDLPDVIKALKSFWFSLAELPMTKFN